VKHEHVLRGCTPAPLASYLKALAILRLVAEQAGDPDATGCWRDDEFVLRTRLTEEELLRFFLETYAPTPLVAPWNGGSGFYPNDNQAGIGPIAATAAKRLEEYRQAVELGRRATKELALSESPKDEAKRLLLQKVRNEAPEALLRWIDAAVILIDKDPRYPPLLGTGGNDGRLDFTNNFMQRLGEVFDVRSGATKSGADALLAAALLGTAVAALLDRAIGQFAPGGAGGPNASSGFEGSARTNPWDFILMLEGAVLLAASAVRRLDSTDSSVMSAPFTVRSRVSSAGSAAAGDDVDSRGEIWMPLWPTPLTLEEAIALFSEGRAALGTRPARDGLDFARAVARLGVDRGIAAFQRFGFLMRSGKAYLATPLARVRVQRNPHADLIDELEKNNWLGNVQRYGRDANAPNAFRAAAGQLDATLFALTQRADRVALQKVLRQLGAIESLCRTSPKAREAIPPVPELSLHWAVDAEDGSAEFRIALALAGLALRGRLDGRPATLTLRPHLAPVSLDGKSWDEHSRLVCWGPGPLARNLAAILHRRRLIALELGNEGDFLASRTGATLTDVMQFLDGTTDDGRIAELLAGLVCVDLNKLEAPRNNDAVRLPPTYALLKPLFAPESRLRYLGWLPADRSLRLPAEITARLAAGDVRTAVNLAWQRLRAIGVKLPGGSPPQAIGLDGARLLAALMVSLTMLETRRVLDELDLTPSAPATASDLSPSA
jgi:CRISPR-associated protein Csx17